MGEYNRWPTVTDAAGVTPTERGAQPMAGNGTQGGTEPAEAAGSGSIFKWETLKEIGPEHLDYETPVPGKVYEVELTSGKTVQVWRADDGQQYFCHGLTFGGKEAPGGPVSPLGGDVPTILQEHYQLVPEEQARAGDVLVWRDDANDVKHSAILTHPVLARGKQYLDDSARLQTKDGMEPETNVSLGDLINDYAEAYNTFRRK